MADSGSYNHAAKRNAHMSRRRQQGLSFSKLGEVFDVAKSTAHRTIKKAGMAKEPKNKPNFAEKLQKPSQNQNTVKSPKAPDSRARRLKPIDTDRGTFRFKDNRKGDSDD